MLIIAMYQGECSQQDTAQILIYLFEKRYSPGYVSGVISMIEEKVKKI